MANMQNQNVERNKGNEKANFKRQERQGQSQEQETERSSESPFQKIPLKAMGTLVTSELVTKFAAPIVDELMESLNERFGEESVQNFISTLAPSFPEGFDFKNLTDWEPVKNKIAKNPVASAAVAAFGVGALYLAREAMAGRGIGKNLIEKAKSFQSGKSSKGKKSPKVVAKRAKTRG